MLGTQRRDTRYGECGEKHNASRMLHDGRHKLIWYPAGNVVQLFDLDNDPAELHDLSADAASSSVRQRLEEGLIAELYGTDLEWVHQGRLTGYTPGPLSFKPDRALAGQRGVQYPQPPVDHPDRTAIRPA